MDIQRKTNRNFQGKYIYDQSLKAEHIGAILKAVDKEKILKKNYDIRFSYSGSKPEQIIISAENKNLRQRACVCFGYDRRIDTEVYKRNIEKVMKKYEKENSKLFFFINKIFNLCKKGLNV